MVRASDKSARSLGGSLWYRESVLTWQKYSQRGARGCRGVVAAEQTRSVTRYESRAIRGGGISVLGVTVKVSVFLLG